MGGSGRGILKRDENREVWKDYRVALRTRDQEFEVGTGVLTRIAPLVTWSHDVQVQKPSTGLIQNRGFSGHV